MKQFSLEEYLKNPSMEVVTRDGRNARIICTDAKGDFPVVTLVKVADGALEIAYKHTEHGNIFIDDTPDLNDIFFVSETHEGWVNVFRDFNGDTYCGSVFDSEEEAKKATSNNYKATIKIEWEE